MAHASKTVASVAAAEILLVQERERYMQQPEILLWTALMDLLGLYRPQSAVSCSTLRERAA